jgi:hypothetical protein
MAAPESRCLVPIWLFDPRITPDCIMPSARAAAIVNWKTDSPRTHYWSMSESSGHRSCKCGAVYDRSEHMVADREISSFECAVCGKTIENWNSSSISIHCRSSSGCRITGRPKRVRETPNQLANLRRPCVRSTTFGRGLNLATVGAYSQNGPNSSTKANRP